MKKRSLLMAASLVLALLVATTGTLAYLSDVDSDVNVMTLGNVQIDQIEMQRVVKDGEWVSTGVVDRYGYTPDEIEPFEDGQPLYPAYFADGVIKWDDRNGSQNASGTGSHQQSWGQIGASGSNQLFDASVKGAMDKFVFVKNTGSSDAYVRTWFAFEQGSVAADNFENVIMTNCNKDHWSWETVATDVEIGDNIYVVKCATYLGPKSNPTGILAPGAVSYPSLLQVYMRPTATNDDVTAIDGNGNGLYDIMVFSQAVQTNNFENAEQALTAAFGENHPWGTTYEDPELPAVTVSTADELAAALANGGTIVLTDDITVDAALTIPADKAVTLVLSDKKITGTFNAPVSMITNNGDLTIEGNGEISFTFNGTVNNDVAANAISNRGTMTVNGGTITNTGVGNQIGYAIDNYNGSTLTVNGGKITASGSSYYDGIRLFCGKNQTTVTINGGEISSIWAQNPSANKATEVKGTVILNGGTVTNTYYENYTTVQVKEGMTPAVSGYGAGSDNTTTSVVNGYTVYSFVH